MVCMATVQHRQAAISPAPHSHTLPTSMGPCGLGGTHWPMSGTSYTPPAADVSSSTSRTASPSVLGSKPTLHTTSVPPAAAGGATTDAGASKPAAPHATLLMLVPLPGPLLKLALYSARSGSQCVKRSTCADARGSHTAGSQPKAWSGRARRKQLPRAAHTPRPPASRARPAGR
jgi:hypothetical protein